MDKSSVCYIIELQIDPVNIRRIRTMTFGERIKKLRREADMTQEYLAELLSIA